MTATVHTVSNHRQRPLSKDRRSVLVTVWLAAVDGPSPPLAALDLLDETERTRAARFHLERDRVRFVNRRLFLREVLSRHLGTHGRNVRLRTSAHGRLELDGPSNLGESAGLSFNASHTAGLAVVTVTQGRAIGVDIEYRRPIADAMDVAAGVFCEREIAALKSSPESRRQTLFLRLWTRKEAVVKATGLGLSTPLDTFDVLDVDDVGTGIPDCHSTALPYTFSDIDAIEDHVGAIAVAGTDVQPAIELRDMR